MRTMLLRANRSLQDEQINEATLAIHQMSQQTARVSAVGSLLSIEDHG